MPKKRILKLKAVVFDDKFEITVLDMFGGVTPCVVSNFQDSAYSCVTWQIKNPFGLSAPCALSFSNGFNLKLFRSRPDGKNTKVYRYTQRSSEYILNALAVIKKSMENYFADTLIDFEFEIINNTSVKFSSIVFATFDSDGEIFYESLDNQKDLTSYVAIGKLIRENNENVTVHSKHKIGIKNNIEDTCFDFIKFKSWLNIKEIKVCYLYNFKIDGVDKKGLCGVIDLNINAKSLGFNSLYTTNVEVTKCVSLLPYGNIEISSLFTLHGVPHKRFVNNTPEFKKSEYNNIYLHLPRIPNTYTNKKAKTFYTKNREQTIFYSQTRLSILFKNIKQSAPYFLTIGIRLNVNLVIDGIAAPNVAGATDSSISTVIESYEEEGFKIRTSFCINPVFTDVFKQIKTEVTEGDYKLKLNCGADDTSIKNNEFNIRLGQGGRTTLLSDFIVDENEDILKAYKKCMNVILFYFAGEATYNMSTNENMSLKPTKRAKVTDYVFAVGCEYETGCCDVKVQKATRGGASSKDGIVYGWHQDGGGLELKTVIMRDPDLFAYIGKFDAMCKEIRRTFSPKVSASTHIHMSIQPTNKKEVPKGKKTQHVNPSWYGSAMFRRKLIANNWLALVNKYTLALGFLDGFNQGGRRNTDYGKRIALAGNGKSKIVKFNDTRYDYLKNEDATSIIGRTGRGSLLRTDISVNATGYIHWEYRGTDSCPSAIFMGLKIEFMQAIAKEAIQFALEGVKLDIWDKSHMDKYNNLAKVKSIFDINDIVCRKEANIAIKELKKWITPSAFRGLMAWTTYVNTLKSDTGTATWFRDMEKMLITKIGTKHFITSDDLDKMFRYAKGTRSFVPKKKATIKEKKFRQIVIAEALINSASCYSGYGSRTGNSGRCDFCGTTYGLRSKCNTGLCAACIKISGGFERLKVTNAKTFAPPKNQTEKTKALIEMLVIKGIGSQ